jgi:CubicO group peptidase (beta-lactamase class C family)
MKSLITKFISIIILAAIFNITSTKCYTQVNVNPTNNTEIPQTIDELKTKINGLLIKYQIPGAGIAIVSKDSLIYCGGFGFANMENKIPVTENTLFRMGSITKSFVALGFLKLVEEGKVGLQTPVTEIVPEIDIVNPWRKTDPVRIVHLLEHTSGFHNSLKGYNVSDDPNISLQQAMKVVSDAFKVQYRPGTIYHYSNEGYGLAGLILEKITGKRYEDYLEEVILDSICMETSTFRIIDENSMKLLAQGYLGNFKESPFINFYSRPAGIMFSSTKDMAKYVQFMLNRGKVGEKQIISETSIKRKETPTTSMASGMGLEFGYGLGTECNYRSGFKWLGHNGAHFGFYTDFWYNLELNIGYVVLINQFDLSIRSHLKKIRNLLASYLVEKINPEFVPAITVSNELLETYTGYYEQNDSNGERLGWINLILGGVSISFENGTLYRQYFMESKEPLIPVTAQLFREPNHPDASVIFFENQEGKMALVDGDSYCEKTYAWKPWLIRIFFISAWVMMLSTIFFAIIWIPIIIYKRITKKINYSKYLRIRIFPLITILTLLYGFIMIGSQDPFYIAEMTFASIQFTISTWLFAGLSFFSLFYAIKSFWEPVKIADRVYALIVSLSCVGMTLFLAFCDMIGLMLWV